MTNIVMAVSTGLQQGQQDGIVRKDIDPQTMSIFLLSSYQGIMGTAKCMQSMELALSLFNTLGDYIDSLRANWVPCARQAPARS
jgi:TetR/AcrR family transcriptional regulator, transcriptional repressor for nem operon